MKRTYIVFGDTYLSCFLDIGLMLIMPMLVWREDKSLAEKQKVDNKENHKLNYLLFWRGNKYEKKYDKKGTVLEEYDSMPS